MSYEAPTDPVYTKEYEAFSERRERLEIADVRHAKASNSVTKFLREKIVRHHQRELYASDQHLGMIEAMQALQAGEPPEAVLREFDS